MNADKRDYLVGIILLAVVVLEWTGSGFLTQGLYNGGYSKAFLVTYLNNSSFILYLLPFLFRYWRSKWGKDATLDSRGYYNTSPHRSVLDVPRTYTSTTPFLDPESSPSPPPTPADLPPLTTRETARLASMLGLFWFLSNWTFNAALGFTSVASVTILQSMSGIFTLGVGRLFGVERFTLWKLGAASVSSLGVLLVSLADSGSTIKEVPLSDVSTSNPPLGDCLTLLSGLFWALYVTLLKVSIRIESRVNMQLFFGFVGVINIVTLWPIGVLLHLTGAEPFQWPTSGDIRTMIVINMFITFSSNYMYLIAMLKTTPLVVTIGLSLTIPVAVLGDWLMLGIAKSVQTLVGATLVIGAFVALGIEGSQSQSEALLDNGDISSSQAATYERLEPLYDDVEHRPERGRSTERRKSLTPSTTTTTRSIALPTRELLSRSPDYERQWRTSGSDAP
ncbi:hypothetical protein FRB93_004593 [Tulasnella sp. JGI-2019a]|nr:hypothetical protein FRB93_004593 [Tulasnella sp. JGI-2019a]